MIQKLSNKPCLSTITLISLGLAMLLALPAMAEVKWPDSLKGQPDFSFERIDITKELEKRKKELGFEPYIANFNDFSQAKDVDPFVPKPRYQRSKTNETGTNPFAPSQIVIEQTTQEPQPTPETTEPEQAAHNQIEAQQKTTLDHLNAGDYNADLSEFTAILDKIVDKHVAIEAGTLKNHNFGKELRKFKLQTVVTAPVPYIIINDKRYTIGDKIPIDIKLVFNEEALRKEIEENIPSVATLPQKQQSAYQNLANGAVAKFKVKVNEMSGGTGAVSHKIMVRVKSILQRKVHLSILDKTYELKLKQ